MHNKGLFEWKLDEFDSSILGFKAVKIICNDPNKNVEQLQKQLLECLKKLKEEKINYALCRVDYRDFSLMHILERNEFLLVDGFIELEKNIKPIMREKEKGQIRVAIEQDKTQLSFLGSNVFSFNRLYNDPYISKEKADLFYSTWVENCLLKKAADVVLVWEEEGIIIGFIALQKKGHIPLIGVDALHRGKGIGRKLILAALYYFLEWEVEKITIGTQIGNIPAIRTYSACGFRVVDTKFSFSWHTS